MEEAGEEQRTRFTRARTVTLIAVVATVVLTLGAFTLGAAQREAESERDTMGPASPQSPRSSTTTRYEPPPSTTSTTSTPAPTTMPAPTTAGTLDDSYAFPVEPENAASYARSHHDYPAADIFAPCGSAVVAPHAGTVQEVTLTDVWNFGTNLPEARGGLSVSIVGDDGVRYYGSHFGQIAPEVRPGARLATGATIGTVGESGNARGTGCHLHFGISTPCGPGDVLRRRGEFWPQQYLDAWRVGDPRSPADLPATSPC